jgi:hypothetical protein
MKDAVYEVKISFTHEVCVRFDDDVNPDSQQAVELAVKEIKSGTEFWSHLSGRGILPVVTFKLAQHRQHRDEDDAPLWEKGSFEERQV